MLNMTLKKMLVLIGLIIVAAAVLAACGGAPATSTPTQAPTVAPTQALPEVPFLTDWQGSGHGNVSDVPFRHWDDATANPDGVPITCAKCHTSAGFVDFAADGKVDNAVPAKDAQGIVCMACHSPEAMALTSVTFPSGKVVETSEEGEARCMTCHQGRESKASVDKQIADFNATDPDKVPAPIKDANGKDKKFGFLNIHYFAAGTTLYGSQAEGGYQYDGKVYDPKFRHVAEMDTCIACHNQHSTTVRVEKCAQCHEGVKTVDDLKNVRMNGSLVDYDGDGNITEGIASELSGIQDVLYAQIQTYAKDTAGTPIAYDGATYPYFFAAGADGAPVKDDKGNPVGYSTWTPRLLKSAFNYQVSVKDPGAFAHNAKYIVELMYDSIEDLGGDVSKLARDDAAHFAGNTEPFRHWDSEGEVPAGCAKCHSAGGLPQFIHNAGTTFLTGTGTLGITGVVAQPIPNGFMCSTCHDLANWPNRYGVTTVPFPSGAKLTFSTEKDADGNLIPVDANLCIECHQGRESTVSVNKYLADKPVDTADPKISFKNIHYFAAGATLFGTDAKGAYEYDGQTYLGYNAIHPLNKCTDCHEVHALNVKTDACKACHTNVNGVADLENIRMATDAVDYNGNGDTTEGIFKEIDSFRTTLYAAIQDYAEKAGTPIVYDAASYPYFFVDADKDGKPDTNDKGLIGYNAWTPRLLKAAYNYQYSIKDPGAFAHNPKYVMQFLYDSIKDLGGDVSNFTRPEAPAPAQ